MKKINIKPLSVNQCFKGRRFKTPLYKQYELNLFALLPRMKLPEPPFKVFYEFGFSNYASDIDNPVKPFTDVLQKRYKFDDKLIEEMILVKKKVKKGEEYIKFNIISIK